MVAYVPCARFGDKLVISHAVDVSNFCVNLNHELNLIWGSIFRSSVQIL